jgi:hypothetical protein
MASKMCAKYLHSPVFFLYNNSTTARLCPFYSDGRCLFAEHCNFLHDAENMSPDASVVGSQPPSISHHSPADAIPSVTVHSPSSVRSPPRSPRFSQLLLALKDVIGEDEEDTTEDILGCPASNESGGISYSVEENEVVAESYDSPAANNRTEMEDDDQPTIRAYSFSQDPESHDDSPDVFSEKSAGELSSLLSPMDILNLPLVPYTRDSSGDSIDSGYADNWTSPFPLLKSPPRSPSVSSIFDPLFSPLRTPSVVASSVTVDLEAFEALDGDALDGDALSPVAVDMATPALADDQYSEPDSAPVLPTPEPEEEIPVTFDGCQSFQPDETNVNLQCDSDQSYSESHEETVTQSPVVDPSLAQIESPDGPDSSIGDGRADSPALADTIGGSVFTPAGEGSSVESETSPSLSQDDVHAIAKCGPSPGCFTSSSPILEAEGTEANGSSPLHSTPPPGPSLEASLSPYLGSYTDSPTLRPGHPADPVNENDTIHTLYDIYCDILSPKSGTCSSPDQRLASGSPNGAELPQSLEALRGSSTNEGDGDASIECVFGSEPYIATATSDVSPPPRSVSPRTCSSTPSFSPVFTPQSGRGRRDPITVASIWSSRPCSSSSPFRTHSSERISPKSQGKRPAASPCSEKLDLESSTKVPFGFRSSSAPVCDLIVCVASLRNMLFRDARSLRTLAGPGKALLQLLDYITGQICQNRMARIPGLLATPPSMLAALS